MATPIKWGADALGKLYGQSVAGMGVGWGDTGFGSGGVNADPRIGMNTFALGQKPGQYKALGFDGDVMIDRPYDPNQNADTIGGQVVNPAFLQWLQQRQYTPVSASDESGQHGALQDASGNIVNGSERQWGDGADDAFGVAALFAGGLAGAYGAGLGATGAAGAGAAGAGDATLGFSLGGANGTIGGAGSQAAMFGQSLGAADAAAGVGGTGLTAAGGGGTLASGLAAGTGTGAGLSAGTGAGLLGGGLGDALTAAGGLGGGLSAAQLASYAGGGGGGGYFNSALDWAKANPTLAGMGGSLLNGALGAYASNKAANTQANAANNAFQATLAQNAQTRADMAPWRAAGQTALGQIGDLMGTSGNTSAPNYGSLNHQFNADDLKSNLAPNYQFQLDQGLGATQNAGNAAGFSGNVLKGVNDYAQGYAGNAYQQAFNNYTANQTNIYNRLSNLAGLGQTANQATGALGSQNVQNAGQFGTSAGAALAAGTIGSTNALTNGINNAGAWNYLNSVNSGSTYSDARLKTDIKRIGRSDKGVGIYSYRYKAGGPSQIGVMAQEVEKVMPRAVTRDAAGFRKVNYTMLRDI